MKFILTVLIAGVMFFLGMSYEIANRPPPVVRIYKAEPARCDLIDRINKRKGQKT